MLDEISGSLSLGMLAGKILPFPADFYSWDQPDVRWILGLMWIAKVLHPELFGDLDLEAEVRYFYTFLYGLDEEIIDAEIIPRIAASLPGKQ